MRNTLEKNGEQVIKNAGTGETRFANRWERLDEPVTNIRTTMKTPYLFAYLYPLSYLCTRNRFINITWLKRESGEIPLLSRSCKLSVTGKHKPLIANDWEGVYLLLDNKSEDLPLQVIASLEEGHCIEPLWYTIRRWGNWLLSFCCYALWVWQHKP